MLLRECGSDLVAQLVEQRPFKAWVVGSSPTGITKLSKLNNMKKFIKWTPVAIALAALFYSVGLGMNGHTDEALYSSHWPVTLLVFYLVIDKINKE